MSRSKSRRTVPLGSVAWAAHPALRRTCGRQRFPAPRSSTAGLASELLGFLVFSLDFGWPLVSLPLVAAALQRRFTRWMTARYALLTRASGLLLVAIGLFGLAVDWWPNL